MFEKTRIILTAWYLLIIMSISILFSFVIYTGVENEFKRFENFRVLIKEDSRGFPIHTIPVPSSRLDPEIIQEARARFLTTLGLINLCILLLSGGAGYFLAGRTLRPIKEMVDDQQRFISDASHELRTPLTSLRTEIEVGLRNKNLTLREATSLIKSNLEEVINLQNLSDNLLSLTQLENGLQKHKEKLDLSLVLSQALKKIEVLQKKKGIIITKQLKPVFILGVFDRVVEVFTILFDNAIKYSYEKSTVEINMKQTKKEVIVTVTNRGEPIDKADVPHLFERFYRGNKSRSKEKIGGYGLGLSIAKQIIDTHEGSIRVRSDKKKGTTFTVSLPLIS